MVIRPMAAAYALGGLGRPANALGGKSGSAPIFNAIGDFVSFGEKKVGDAGLYSSRPLFKIMGAVELMSPEPEMDELSSAAGDAHFLI